MNTHFIGTKHMVSYMAGALVAKFNVGLRTKQRPLRAFSDVWALSLTAK